jgi:carboxynorspermidine decarboxylase
MYSLYPDIKKYLYGTTASSLHEARLGCEEMGGEVHIFAPAYREDEFQEILSIADHIVFNSFSQWDKYKSLVKASERNIECGIRVNPEYSELEHEIYDPSSKYSRLGVTAANFETEKLQGIDGIHFHTMCEQNSDTLERTVEVFEQKFGKYLSGMKWVNFGGGHHITRDDYDVDRLVNVINRIMDKYDVQVYLEPGEAVALNAGYLAVSVLDIVRNEMDIAIIDSSASCHMPDVIEMPYRPHIVGSGKPDEYEHTYRIGGMTCLAGDIVGDYSFREPLKAGDLLIFTDMAIYSMVKTNTFNGINLPSIAIADDNGIEVIKKFGYEDFKRRL